MSRVARFGVISPVALKARLVPLALTCAVWAQGVAVATAQTAPATLTAAATFPATTAKPATMDYGLTPHELAPGHWVIEGAVDDFGRHNGCNIINTAFIVTAQGALVINTGPSRLYGEQQRQAVERVVRQVTGQPPTRGSVLNLNLHPDYFFGNQAWGNWPTQALAGSRAGMRAEGPAYADNLYRLCGDWMKGTESTPAQADMAVGELAVGPRKLQLHRLQGHTADDLVVLDPVAGVAYVGGLVFMNRVPTTPHADFDRWLTSLDVLEALLTQGNYKWVVPSHGPVHSGLAGLQQTRDWLKWLTNAMQTSADKGLDLNEMLHQPNVPPRFANWAAMPAELQRSLTQWFPLYEARALTH
jgi:quinoprotein relay system zinc metallohydrolase 1